MAARITVRGAMPAALANGSRTDVACPAVSVNAVAVPSVPPLAFVNTIVPVQDAAVPVFGFTATFATLTSAVSLLPRPIGGKLKVRVLEVVVCPMADDRPAIAMTINARFLPDMFHLFV